jgi:outer membrane protein OmpA-like peptidoglycan-associated protein
MFGENILRKAILALSVLLLIGCANNQNRPAGDDGQGTATSSAASNETTPPPPPPPPKPVVVIPNPSVINFEKMSVSVDDQGKFILDQLADKAKSSSKLLVTGFCDSQQIKNATDSAIARATAVRDELLARGVVASNIRVTINTRVRKKHAVEIKFD